MWIEQGAYWKVQWSPDGSQILFDVGSKIYAVDAEGWTGTPRTVAEAHWEVVIDGEVRAGGILGDHGTASFDVSPDGKIAFSRCADRLDGYKFLDGDRKGDIVLSHVSGGREVYKGLVMVADHRHEYEIAVANLDGTDAKGLIQHTAPPGSWYGSSKVYRWPAWSPDGSRVAYLGDWRKGSEDTIYSVAADGTDERLLIAANSLDFSLTFARFPPVWSPDGRHLAVLSYNLEEVYTVRSDGSDLTLIVTEALSAPAWTPDGRIGVAVSDGEGGAVLRTFAPDGSDPVTIGSIMSDGDLAHTEVNSTYTYDILRYFPVQNLSWSPDGSKIMYTCGIEIGTAICVADAADGSVSWVATTELKIEDQVSWAAATELNPADVADGSLVLVGPELHTHAVAAWSPDGSKIAIANLVQDSPLSGYLSLYTITSDGRSGQTIVGAWCVPERRCYFNSED